jgi:hypothetical protein
MCGAGDIPPLADAVSIFSDGLNECLPRAADFEQWSIRKCKALCMVFFMGANMCEKIDAGGG